MADRAPIPSAVLNEVLTKSARRCALCLGLDGSLKRVDGQIAHVDRDASNPALANLAYLCLPHHNEYDSRPSQSKGFAPGELILYRERLYAVIERNEHHRTDPVVTRVQSEPKTLEHDQEAFKAADSILSEERLFTLLKELGDDHSYESDDMEAEDSVRSVRLFVRHLTLESNRFVLEELLATADILIAALNNILDFFSAHFSVTNYFNYETSSEGYKAVMHPELNSDRVGIEENTGVYGGHALALGALIRAVEEAYREYRRTVKRTLLV